MTGNLNSDYVLMNVPGGGQVWLEVPAGTGCAITTVTKTQDEISALPTTLPDAPSGATVDTRICDDVVVTAFDEDFAGGTDQPTTGTGFDTSYTFEKTGTDYAGRALVATPAPKLTAVSQTKPRLTGNAYNFTPQTALMTSLHKRHPQFTVHPKKVIGYPGTLFTNMDDNDMIGRGYTHVTESAKWSDPDHYPTQFRRMIEGSFYILAYEAANSGDVGPSDPRYQQLMDWAGPKQPVTGSFEGPHVLITDEAAARRYGEQWYRLFKTEGWAGAGIDFFSVNFEHMEARGGTPYSAHQQQYRMVGWVTQGAIEAAAAEGKTLLSGLSAEFGNLTTYAPWFHDMPATQDRNGNPLPEPNAGIPQYMHYALLDEFIKGTSSSAPLGENSTLATLIKTGKAYMGVGRYIQHTMDDQSYFQKASGAYLLDGNGNPQFRSEADRTTTITGQSTVIYTDDYFMAMIKLYGIVAQFCSNIRFRAGGKDLPLSTDRQSGWEAMKGQTAQFRLDGEGESGVQRPDAGALNERPLAPDMTEGYGILMYLLSDYMRGWMQSQLSQALGADNGYGSKARASSEIYQKAFQRAANLNWIHDTPWQLIQPKFWIFKQGINGPADADEHFARKPIILGGLASLGGAPWIWLFAWWPCQDVDKTTDVKLWINKGSGTLTPSYVARMAGRKPFLDAWPLPTVAAGAAPKDVLMQFASLTGQTITWCGDYRVARITNHPAPPPVA